MRHLRMGVSAVLLAVASGACAATTDAVDSSDQGITGGAVDGGDPAVVLLSLGRGSTCSATMIRPDVALSAAHCGSGSLTVYAGTGAPSAGFSPQGMEGRRVKAALRHPEFWEAGAPIELPDLMLVRLEQPTATPALGLAAAVPVAGQRCRVVGFGLSARPNGDDTIGQKRTTDVRIVQVSRTLIEVDPGENVIRKGDSGGALICGGRLAGVAHAAGATRAFFVRVDAERRAWIDRNAAPDADWSQLDLRPDGCPRAPFAERCSPQSPQECRYEATVLVPDAPPCTAKATCRCDPAGHGAWTGSITRCDE